MKPLLANLILLSISTAYASTYHGVVQQIRIAATSVDGTRVSVLTSATTDCHGDRTNNGWYSFTCSSKTGLGKAWFAALLSAKVTQQRVVIHGTGTCDASGMEGVTAIDLPAVFMPHFPAAPVRPLARPAARIDLGHGWPALQLLEAFDRAAHLSPPSNGSAPELRVWEAPFLGNTVGYLISVDRAFACSASYRNDGRTASVEQADCEVSDMPVAERQRALSLLPTLSDLNGKSWGCALGGQTFFVEGFINNRRFAFSVSNPEQCPQSGSLPVKRLLEVIRF
ncbi:MAG: hypothetical protein WAU49_13760 [Steroidobacteraceae bacterium]